MVKRYTPVRQHGGCIMVEYEDGGYVRHREHAALAERCERLEGALRDVLSANDKLNDPQWDGSPVQEAALRALSGSSGGKDG